jgi:hypothetical protein
MHPLPALSRAASFVCRPLHWSSAQVGDDELYRAQADTVDMMRVLGADGFPKHELYGNLFIELVDAYCHEQGYDEHDSNLVRPALLTMLHEEAAASSTAWRRIIPSAEGYTHLGYLHQGSGFATDLDAAATDFIKWRETSAPAQAILMRSQQQISQTAAGIEEKQKHEYELLFNSVFDAPSREHEP